MLAGITRDSKRPIRAGLRLDDDTTTMTQTECGGPGGVQWLVQANWDWEDTGSNSLTTFL